MPTAPQAAGHNLPEVLRLIKRADVLMIPIEAEIETLRAEIKEKRAGLTKIKHEMVKAQGIKIGIFEELRKIAHLEDEEDRAESLRQISVVSQALGIGEQGDLAAGWDEEYQPEQNLSAITRLGAKAATDGRPKLDCPYPDDTQSHAAWMEGYLGEKSKAKARKANEQAVEGSQGNGQAAE